MKSDIKQIKVVSNTHWDREFRMSFEKTRRRLLDMLDITMDILEQDPKYHSFTMDGHSIMIDDYLEMRPERTELVNKLIKSGRLIIGPYYTLAEQFSIGHEAMVRNLMWGQKTVNRYGGNMPTVAYTPSSWGQTGQLPQILKDFGIDTMMFYRGISHHESDAEWVWQSPDGSEVLASRFAVYARYNWYYQVHRAVTRDKVFDKGYDWEQNNEIPFRVSDSLAAEDNSFELLDPALDYDKTRLRQAIEDMIDREGDHFTSEIFLAMHGHDISVAHPLESQIIEDAQKEFNGQYEITHTDLENFWHEFRKKADISSLSVLKGERRANLKEGMWTFLFPATISARTYLKQQDFDATAKLVYSAEPLASLAYWLGMKYPKGYLDRAWQYLLSNHTHDANGGCAPDAVCLDMEYRYRKVKDIADIVVNDSLAYIAKNLKADEGNRAQLIVFNSLPVRRDEIIELDLEIPVSLHANSIKLTSKDGSQVKLQAISMEKSSSFIDNIWDVPTILETTRQRYYARFISLPALGYRTYVIEPCSTELRNYGSLVTGPLSMENENLKVRVNNDGTIDVLNKLTNKHYYNLNYLSDQGECGNAWKHMSPVYDRKYVSLGVDANISIIENGPLVSRIQAEYNFAVPADYADGLSRNKKLVDLPVKVIYTLKDGAEQVEVKITVENNAKDHWLRANFPTGIDTDYTSADSHYDVVDRKIKLPDSSGWVEPATGTHPLRTFISMSDHKDGFSLFTKGVFEYEAFDDEDNTLAITLIRACRIKLAVSEEKLTELSDRGIQCPGRQVFEYAINVHEGNWQQAGTINVAAKYYTPVRAVMAGSGKGEFPHEQSLLEIDNPNIHISCIKKAEDSDDIIVRMFNPTESEQVVEVEQEYKKVTMAEGPLCKKNSDVLSLGKKKIITILMDNLRLHTCE